MSPLEFLQFVLSESGYIAIAVKVGKGFRHKVVETYEDAIKVGTAVSDSSQDAYFALGTLKERSVEIPQADGTVKSHVRIGSNIHSLKCLFIDIDIDPAPTREGKACYPTQAAALVDLKRAIKALDFPKPMIVQSGGASGGLHVYFPFDAGIPADDWYTIAAKFKAALSHLGVQQDRTRTADRSSVLRIPGTLNQKRKERVAILMEGVRCYPESLNDKLDKFIQANSVTVVQASQASAAPVYLQELGENLIPAKPVSFPRIVRGCRQMQQAVRDRGNVPEPIWYARLQLARFCEKSDKVVHFLSDGYPNYSYTEVEKKVQQLVSKSIGPTLCTTFEQHDPAPCSQCPHRSVIKSPIVLGVEIPEAKEPIKAEVETASGTIELVTIPKPPWPFKRREGGGVFLEDPSGEGPAVVIYDHDLYPLRRFVRDSDHKEEIVWRVHLPHDGLREFSLPSSTLSDARLCMSALYEKGVYIPQARRREAMVYLTNYVQELQRATEAERLFSQLGWTKNGFVTGDAYYTKDGKSGLHNPLAKPILSGLTTAGSHEEWMRAVLFLRKPGMEAFSFGFLTAFGAPLLAATDLTGAVINIFGESGGGKTTSLRASASVWGDHRELVMNGDKTGSTAVGRLHFLTISNNLPVYFDEVTNLSPEDASSLVYSVSVGRNKMKGKKDGSGLQDNIGSWRTMMLTSSNASFYDKFLAFKKNASAEMARLLDVPAPSHQEGDKVVKDQADAMQQIISVNYGWSGRLYIEYLVKNKQVIFERVRKLISRIDAIENFNTMERFWIGMVAANIVGGRAAIECGALSWQRADLDRVLHWSIMLLRQLGGEVKSHTNTFAPRSQFADFVSEHIDQFLHISSASGEIVQIKEPRNELVGTLDRATNTLWIRRGVFQAWLVKNGLNSREIVKNLVASGIMLSREVRKNLTAGTRLPAAQARCYSFKLNPDDDGDVLDSK